MKAADNEELHKEKHSLTGGDEGADTDSRRTRDKQVDTTKIAGHNPNIVQAPQKPMAHQKPTPQSGSEPSVFGNNLSEFIDFLKETWQEFRKISWPNREQVIRETWSVLVLVAAITGAVLAFDWVIAKSVFEPLDRYAKKMGGGVGHTMTPFAPLAPQPGAPLNNPSVPGSVPGPQNAPAGSLPAPAGTTPVAPAPQSPTTSGSSAPAGGSPAAPTPGGTTPKSELDKFTPAPAAPSAPPTNGK